MKASLHAYDKNSNTYNISIQFKMSLQSLIDKPKELLEFVEGMNQTQFAKVEEFFNNLPKLKEKIEMTCKKCNYHHVIDVEGLENFFG